MIITTLKFQLSKIKCNIFTFTLIVLTSLIVLYIGFMHNTITQCLAYLFVMWICSFVVDFYALKHPAKNDFIVRNPKKETFYFFMCFILGMIFFFIRFSGLWDWQQINPLIRLATIPLILCVYPVALASILLLMKYKPSDLGIRMQGFIVAIPIIVISAITNRIVSPSSFTWDKIIADEGSVIGVLFSGFIVAGLSEEFFRVIGQTRMGALLKNNGMGWFITTTIWALMHAPKWYSDEHNINEALLGSIRIIPIGLMWGYITHRTKSILPSVIVHGSNFWGLQNF
jgi:membrane protease YdiL (CAAX protease family)